MVGPVADAGRMLSVAAPVLIPPMPKPLAAAAAKLGPGVTVSPVLTTPALFAVATPGAVDWDAKAVGLGVGLAVPPAIDAMACGVAVALGGAG